MPLTAATTEALRDYLANHPRADEPNALARRSVAEAEKRLVLDWTQPGRHGGWCKAVYRPSVLHANRLIPTAALCLS